MGKYDEALKDQNKAIMLDPKYAAAYNNRGFTHFNMGNYREAVADYTKAIEFRNTYALAYYNRAVARTKLGEMDAAVQDLKDAARLGEKDARDALKELGITK